MSKSTHVLVVLLSHPVGLGSDEIVAIINLEPRLHTPTEIENILKVCGKKYRIAPQDLYVYEPNSGYGVTDDTGLLNIVTLDQLL